MDQHFSFREVLRQNAIVSKSGLTMMFGGWMKKKDLHRLVMGKLLVEVYFAKVS